ncbi:tRNA (N6-isopentenyl adenosine(37)-C2)-methylthiotransferase MiaB [bacterium]|nr:tRNA (N6-isopentenyl adenosine(37)-C2)-methylthiotransferase MiaB [bacterium]
MNVLEAQKMEGHLLSLDYEKAHNEFEADLVIFNTCAVRHTAERKIFGKIGEVKKKGKPGGKIAVGGCVSQVEGEILFKKYKNIDIVFGSRNKNLISVFYHRALNGERVLDLTMGFDDFDLKYATNAKRDSKYSAFVEIMKGCNNYCTYCIVPYARGKELSYTPKNILNTIKTLIDQGYKEITLLGQNVNSFGTKFVDDVKRNYSFLDLLNDIEKIQGIFLLRFITSHPKDFNNDLIDIMADSNILAHSLHLPLQSGSNRILKLMNRKYTIEEYLNKIEYLKTRIPDIALTTDMIFGFPGETEKDFEDSIAILKKVRYNVSFLFQFSPRINTPAAKMEDLFVPEKEKLKRLQYAIEIQNEISLELSKKYIGTKKKVLFDGVDRTNKYARGRDSHNMIVIAGDKSIIGKIRDVKINDANSFTLFGDIL